MTENINDRNDIIHRAGRLIASSMKNFYGKVTLNLQDGRYVNANIEESIKPESNNAGLSPNKEKDDT